MSTLKKTKNTHWMIKLVCKCLHSKSHSINHKQNYSESLSYVYSVLKSDFDKHHHCDRNTIPHRPSGSFYKSMSQYHKDSSCCKYKANLASPRSLTILHSTLGTSFSPSLFHPYSSGDPRSGLAMWEEIQILVCQAALLTCYFRLSSQGGSFANTHSCLAASFARNTFMFECASFSLPLGSYKLAMNL